MTSRRTNIFGAVVLISTIPLTYVTGYNRGVVSTNSKLLPILEDDVKQIKEWQLAAERWQQNSERMEVVANEFKATNYRFSGENQKLISASNQALDERDRAFADRDFANRQLNDMLYELAHCMLKELDPLNTPEIR